MADNPPIGRKSATYIPLIFIASWGFWGCYILPTTFFFGNQKQPWIFLEEIKPATCAVCCQKFGLRKNLEKNRGGTNSFCRSARRDFQGAGSFTRNQPGILKPEQPAGSSQMAGKNRAALFRNIRKALINSKALLR